MEKEKLREIVKKSVEEVWYNRRSMNIVEDQTELLTEALHQALSMSGVKSCTCIYDCDNCGAKEVKPISMGNECCPKCYS